MSNQMIFKRYELKFMMTKAQRDQVLQVMKTYMDPDPHGKSTIQSLYFDTPEFLLVRRSMEKPLYKEKLRLRSYGVATEDTEVFMELKKKYDSVVYKRREGMTEREAGSYIQTHVSPRESQIFKEIDYTLEQYKGLKPTVLLSYDREAYYAKDDHDFRMTFDENILWRDYDVDLKKGIYGTNVIDSNLVLMEVKVAAAIPLWLVRLMNELGISKTSFSKYGTAYQAILARDAGVEFAPVTLENRYVQEARLRRSPLYTGIGNQRRTNTDNYDFTNQNEAKLGGNFNYA